MTTAPGVPIAQWLSEQGAHHDVVEWAAPHGDDWRAMWEACPRGDWLLGIAARRGVDPKRLVEAACACAELAFDQLPEGEDRPAEAVSAARAWIVGSDDAAARAEANARVDAAIEEAPDPAVAAVDCGLGSAVRYAQAETADRVRAHIPFDALPS